MNAVLIVPIGEVDAKWLDAAEGSTRDMMNTAAVVAPCQPVPPAAFDSRRKQFLATALLEQLLPIGNNRNTHVLGITEVDLFIPILTFMFGQAQLGGRLALVSVARLKPEFYGLPPDRDTTILRLRKEIRHELGHTLGLVHCSDRSCAMSLSNSIVQADAKRDAFCEACEKMSRARLARLNSGGIT